jgi:hypothetical protein
MVPDKKCVQRCVRQGSKYGLWVGRHVYELEPQSKATRYAASDVSVTGTLDGETIHSDSIEPAKRALTKKAKSNQALGPTRACSLHHRCFSAYVYLSKIVLQPKDSVS